MIAVAALVILAAPLAGQVRAPLPEVMVIKESITLPKGAVLRKRIRIAASNIVIDGNGATLLGPIDPTKPTKGQGVGIVSDGRFVVTLKNIRVRGFEIGLRLRDASGWVIEGCDFSDNYHDPEFGWGDGRRVGGMVFDRVSNSTVRNTKALRNWNGLDLWDCDRNKIQNSDFSHCSNVCLKLWHSSFNTIKDNNLSYGLRIRKGEVHARDSTGVLIESGSNSNDFSGNDVTHGGDGIFIRVLNNWVSTGNTFHKNDCSYANNNGFESWSPGNTYVGNTANHCSYGFWLGGSDNTVLIQNEASFNGLANGFHNAPEPDFGHGGIVIVNGSGSHTLIDRNTCIGNNGGGIVFRGDLGTRGAKWKMRHLVVQRNDLKRNRWGLFARFVDGLDLSSNHFEGNEKDELLEDVVNLHRHRSVGLRALFPGRPNRPRVRIVGPVRVVVGEEVRIKSRVIHPVGKAQLRFRWDVAGREYTKSDVEHTFTRSGFHRVSLTVDDGKLAGLAHFDVYVANLGEEPATEDSGARLWRVETGETRQGRDVIELNDDRSNVIGGNSVKMRVSKYTGTPLRMSVSGRPRLDFSKIQRIEFWLKSRNPSNGGFRGPNPTIHLRPKSADGVRPTAWTYVPVRRGLPRNLLRDVPYSEARDGWSFVSIPIAGGDGWQKRLTHVGGRPPFVSQRLHFTTVQATFASSTAASLVSAGDQIFCVADPGGRLYESNAGEKWRSRGRYGQPLETATQWINGMLTFAPKVGERGSLLLTAPARKDSDAGHGGRQIIFYDLAEKRWRWHQTITAMTHGATLIDGKLFGLAHAVMGNYGGPLCRIDLRANKPLDDHSVLGGIAGADAGWLSRAAQLTNLGGKIYGIKNDWKTPQPGKNPGDRLFVFDPSSYRAAKFAGGKRWDARQWKADLTPCEDLSALPFEVGHGASLVALPPEFGGIVGAKGGLFILAGCSPSNHEGRGQPSDLWAVYDIATSGYTIGKLPAATGAGTSACRHGDRLIIKRGGVHEREGDAQVWIVRTLAVDVAARARAKQRVVSPDLSAIDRMEIQFQSAGDRFTIWIDGLKFARNP